MDGWINKMTDLLIDLVTDRFVAWLFRRHSDLWREWRMATLHHQWRHQGGTLSKEWVPFIYLFIYLFTSRRVSFSSVSFFAASIIYTKWLYGMGEINEELSKWVSEGLIEWWNELLTFHAFIWSMDWLIDRYWWIGYLVVWSFDWLLAWFTAATLFWFIAHSVSCSQLVLHCFPLHAQTGEVITWKQSD